MAGLNRAIDPETRDYVSDGAGGTLRTRDARTPIYHQIAGRLGQWALDPAAGSRLDELRRAKNTLTSPVVIRDILTQALQPLIDEGRISEPTIESDRQVDRVDTKILVTDLSSGQPLDLVELLQFIG